MSEFDIIERYFLPLTMGQAGCGELKDDGAVINIPDGYELVVTSDTLNAGVHFLEGEAAHNIARKALRVNLSDLASMGAKPLCYQLNIAFPEKPTEAWLSAFSKALQEDNALYDVYCSGGDTTSIKGGFLSISITAMGLVPKGAAVRRGGAKEGYALLVTGTIGDAVLGLRAIRASAEDDYARAVSRYQMPQPRMGVHEIMRKYARAAADVSDGLLADSMNIAKASGLGLEIDPLKTPLSKDVQLALDNNMISWQDILCGGDDYELILAVPEALVKRCMVEFNNINIDLCVIGRFTSKALGLHILDTITYRIDDKNLGWKHF